MLCVEPNYRRCVKAVGEIEKLSDPCAPLPTVWGRGALDSGAREAPRAPTAVVPGAAAAAVVSAVPAGSQRLCAIARCPFPVLGRACAATHEGRGDLTPGCLLGKQAAVQGSGGGTQPAAWLCLLLQLLRPTRAAPAGPVSVQEPLVPPQCGHLGHQLLAVG